jgi:long-chain acyl-CoA synthetase
VSSESVSTATGGLRNVADVVSRAATQAGDRTALVFRDTSLTWAELDAKVDDAAAALRLLARRAGDRVAIALPNGLDFATTFFGALRAGLVAIPVNPSYTGWELQHLLGDSGARVLVATGGVAKAATALAGELPQLAHIVVAGKAASLPGGDADGGPRTQTLSGLLAEAAGAVPADPPADPPADQPADPRPDRGGEDLAVLLYTSGVSGRPKGAMLSHRAMLANLQQCARIEPPVLRADDVVLLVLPLFHVYGLGPGLCLVAYYACTGVLVERFDPVDTLALLQRHRVSVVSGAPPMFTAWSLMPDFAESFAGVRLAVSGAAPLDPAAQRRLLDTTGQYVFEGYGLTETCPVVTTTLMSAEPKPGSVGQPIPGVELRLVDVVSGADLDLDGDSDDDEHPGGGSEPGEIVVRGTNLFSGYWPDGREGPDDDGWWRTGDVGYLDDDGDLFLSDRIKELILVSGFNVYPREVEDVLLAHADVVEAGVIGVPHPYTGETVKAFLVLAEGASLDAEDVVAHCEQRLARFKCPTAVEFVDELPHSATGKVRKAQLRAEALVASGAAGAAATSDESAG